MSVCSFAHTGVKQTVLIWFSFDEYGESDRAQFLSIRLNSSHGGGISGDSAAVHESLHHPQTTPDGFSRPSSDEGENEEREDNAEKLDCHYSGYHPRPAAVSALHLLLPPRNFPFFITLVKPLKITVLICSSLLFPVLYFWESTVWERLLYLWPAMGQSAMYPHHNDGKACQLPNVEVSQSLTHPFFF